MQKLLIGLLALTALVSTGCDETKKLAGEVTGTWTSNPTPFIATDGSTATSIENIVFERDSTSNGGMVIITSLISSTGSFTGSSTIMSPFSVSAAPKSYISGHWTAVDDDELLLALDPATMTVEVDPDAVVITSDLNFSPETSPIDSIRPQIAGAMKATITQILLQHYVNYQELDDVKVKGSTLQFEVKDEKHLLTRQGPAK